MSVTSVSEGTLLVAVHGMGWQHIAAFLHLPSVWANAWSIWNCKIPYSGCRSCFKAKHWNKVCKNIQNINSLSIDEREPTEGRNRHTSRKLYFWSLYRPYKHDFHYRPCSLHCHMYVPSDFTQVTQHRKGRCPKMSPASQCKKILVVKPTRSTKFSNLFLE